VSQESQIDHFLWLNREFKMPLQKLLTSQGIAALDLGYSSSIVADWNRKLDGPFGLAAQSDRSYVDAEDLLENGVLQGLFNAPLREAISSISNDPVVCHCHAYEIAGGQEVSHIHAGALRGWHGDDECVPHYKSNRAEFISIFVYLTDVDNGDDGAFELRPLKPDVPFCHGQPSIEVLGPAGTTFAFNRAFAHRARPNANGRRRRVLKLSIQERQLPHERRNLTEFATVRDAMCGSDTFLEKLFDTAAISTSPAQITQEVFDDNRAWSITPNSCIELGLTGRLKTAIGGGRIAA
jgi:hypothetical protein